MPFVPTITAGPTEIDCGHSGHYFSQSASGSLFNVNELNGTKVIITEHLDTQFNNAHPSCGLPNCLVALVSADNGATWTLIQGPTFTTYLNNGTLVVGNTVYGGAATAGQFYCRTRSTRIYHTIHTTYQSANGVQSVVPFDLDTLAFGAPVVIATSVQNALSGFGVIAPNGIGVVCTNRVPAGSGTPVVFKYARFDVNLGFLNDTTLVSPNNQDRTDAPEDTYVDDAGIIRIIYKTRSLDNLTAYRVVAGWPTNQNTPTIYDEFVLFDPTQTLFHSGHRAAKDGTKFVISERRQTAALEINVYTFKREVTNHISQSIEQAVDNTTENDNFAYNDVAMIGPCRVLFIAPVQAGGLAHGWQLKFKLRNLNNWPVFTPSIIVYDAGSGQGPLTAVLGTFFGGDIVANGEYEFLSGANPAVNPVQFTLTHQIFYWRMTIPGCPAILSVVLPVAVAKPTNIVILPDPRVHCKNAVQLRCITRGGKTFRMQPNKVVTYALSNH